MKKFEIGCLLVTMGVESRIFPNGKETFIDLDDEIGWVEQPGKNFQLLNYIKVEIRASNQPWWFKVCDKRGQELAPHREYENMILFISPYELYAEFQTGREAKEVFCIKHFRRDNQWFPDIGHHQESMTERPTEVVKIEVSKIDHYRRPNGKRKTRDDYNSPRRPIFKPKPQSHEDEPEAIEVIVSHHRDLSANETEAMLKHCTGALAQRLNLDQFKALKPKTDGNGKDRTKKAVFVQA